MTEAKKMTVIITMAGLGERFKKAGFNCPKYMIEAKGKSLFEWSMDSLIDYNKNVSKYIFVVRKDDNAETFIKDKFKKYDINEVEVIEIDELTDGQASTCLIAIKKCAIDSPILVYNIDTYVEPYGMRLDEIKGDGHIPCFDGEGDHWSFVKTNEKGNAIEVREKKRISNNCTLGAYYFSSAELYKKMYDEYYGNEQNIECGEKYVAPLFNLMINKGLIVSISIVNKEKVHVLGTPNELNEFIKE